jgi:hypothetical protein
MLKQRGSDVPSAIESDADDEAETSPDDDTERLAEFVPDVNEAQMVRTILKWYLLKYYGNHCGEKVIK